MNGSFTPGGNVNSAPGVRIGTAEREHAAKLLGEHFSAGRLEVAEFDERVRQAYLARTTAELNPLFLDLPGAATSQPRERRRPGRQPLRVALIVLLAIAVVAWMSLVRLPPFFLFPLLWLGFGRSRRRSFRMARR